MGDVWFRGTYQIASDRDRFGEPRPNKMERVSFKEASLWGTMFSNGCDLSTVTIPDDGNHVLYSDWPDRLEGVRRASTSWPDEERAEASMYVKSHLVHAGDQRWNIVNTEEIREEFSCAGEKIVSALNRGPSTTWH